jgi:hypothetical protein
MSAAGRYLLQAEHHSASSSPSPSAVQKERCLMLTLVNAVDFVSVKWTSLGGGF